jgi:GAF domain-containing protein
MAALDDPARLAALERLDLLEGKPDSGFDRYTALAAKMLDAPVALVSLVDSSRQTFLSRRATYEPWISLAETPLSHSFCQHAVTSKAPLVISDARNHPLVSDNPAIEEYNLISYAGAPIITRDDQALGTLCVLDHEPRDWTPAQVEMLSDLAATVAREIELRARMRR